MLNRPATDDAQFYEPHTADSDMQSAGTPDTLVPVEHFLTRVFSAPRASGELRDLVTARIFKPRADADPFPLPASIDWEAQDRHVDRNWRMQLQGWLMFAPVMNAFDSGDAKPEAVAYFLQVVADWWRHYGDDAEDIVTSRMPESYAWYDMSVGYRALILGFFLNRIAYFRIALPEDLTRLLGDVAEKHIRQLARPQVFSLNNHGIFQMHGLLALTNCLPDPARFAQERSYAITRMTELLDAQFDESGIHREHSPHYHFYALKMFTGALLSGWYGDRPAFTQRVELAMEARKWLVDPLRRPICVGDSVLTRQSDVTFPAATEPAHVISDFDASGYAVLRSAWGVPADAASMVFLMGAYHATTHKHRDCLSFDWFDKGRRIICDGGKYGYRSDVYRRYALSYAAHNNIEFDGFDIIKMSPYGSAIEGTEELPGGIFRMTAALRMKAITHVRRLHVKPGHWILIEDDIEQGRPRKIRQRWHLDSDFGLQRLAGRVLHAMASDGQGITIEPFGWKPEPMLQRGDSAPVQGYSFTADLKLEPALALTYSGEVQNGKLLTAMSLSAFDRQDVQSYCHAHFGLPRPKPESLPDVKALLPNVPHRTVRPDQALMLSSGTRSYTMLAGGLALSFLATRRPGGSKRLLVMLPGASARKHGHLDFQRHGWGDDYPDHDIVAISDPSLKPGNDIGLAWFQNSAAYCGLDALAEGLSRICEAGRYAPQDVVILGSSGGGFAGLMLARRFPMARIIAFNPQLDLRHYSRSAYLKMLGTCYPGFTESAVQQRFGDRMRVSPELVERTAPIFLFQNEHDTLHLNHHLTPLLQKVPAEKQAEFTGRIGPRADWRILNIIRYADPALGHSPPSRADTGDLIRPLLAGAEGLAPD